MGSRTGFIYHITTREAWSQAATAGHYTTTSLAEEGFIHCSTRAQLLGPAHEFFHGRSDLVLLQIDSARVTARVVDEDLTGKGQAFPHIYGALNLDAVTAVFDFPPNPDGTFGLPPALQMGG